jgi:extracellular elastinolytic metalloproteinase
MRAIIIFGLAGHALHVHAHPARHSPNPQAKTYLTRRTVDLNSFRLSEAASYVNVAVARSDPIVSLFKGESYLDTATQLVKSLAPSTNFRLVDDYYVGTNGIAHVNFKQTLHGLDIDNADFNINVCVITGNINNLF